MKLTNIFFVALMIMLSSLAYATNKSGGEHNNTNCNGVGNSNSPCSGGGSSTSSSSSSGATNVPVTNIHYHLSDLPDLNVSNDSTSTGGNATISEGAVVNTVGDSVSGSSSVSSISEGAVVNAVTSGDSSASISEGAVVNSTSASGGNVEAGAVVNNTNSSSSSQGGAGGNASVNEGAVSNNVNVNVDNSDDTPTPIILNKESAASAAPTFSSLCTSGVSGQRRSGGLSFSVSSPVCVHLMMADAMLAIGDKPSAMKHLKKAEKHANVKGFMQYVLHVVTIGAL